jgi:hypothetical protein
MAMKTPSGRCCVSSGEWVTEFGAMYVGAACKLCPSLLHLFWWQ